MIGRSSLLGFSSGGDCQADGPAIPDRRIDRIVIEYEIAKTINDRSSSIRIDRLRHVRMAADDGGRSRVDPTFGLCALLIGRQRVRLDAPVDKRDDYVRVARVLGVSDILDDPVGVQWHIASPTFGSLVVLFAKLVVSEQNDFSTFDIEHYPAASGLEIPACAEETDIGFGQYIDAFD